MRVIYLETALDDLIWMRHYYENIFPTGARNAQQQFHSCQQLLLENPDIGHSTHRPGVREFSIPRIPFSFIYRPMPDRIEVLRVWDERQENTAID